MEIIARAMDWTSVDEENFGKFLDTETGRRLIPRLLEGVPQLSDGGDTNRLLIRSGEVRGWQACVRDLLMLSHAQPQQAGVAQNQAYPPLEQDEAWNDGQKIENTNPQAQ